VCDGAAHVVGTWNRRHTRGRASTGDEGGWLLSLRRLLREIKDGGRCSLQMSKPARSCSGLSQNGAEEQPQMRTFPIDTGPGSSGGEADVSFMALALKRYRLKRQREEIITAHGR
jgi:hypothetical protein